VNRARVATLAGTLAFFDLNDPLAARGYFNLALESAREAGDHLQAAAVLGQMARIPEAEASYSAALDYIRAARHQAGKCPNARVESWLVATESKVHTSAGSHAAALRAIDRARDKLTGPHSTADPPWFDYHDETRLSGIAGYALLCDHQIEASRAALSDVVAHLPARAVKSRGQRLVELALVDLAGGDLDRACATASEAADLLRTTDYAFGVGRLREFRRAVEPWASSTPVRELDEQLAELR
jgi:hypothetical protein